MFQKLFFYVLGLVGDPLMEMMPMPMPGYGRKDFIIIITHLTRDCGLLVVANFLYCFVKYFHMNYYH